MRFVPVANLSFLFLFFGSLAAACALNAEGLNAGDDPASTGAASTGAPDPPDASSDSSRPPDTTTGQCTGDPSDCAAPVPGGWQRVGYAGHRDADCAPGFAAFDFAVDPSPSQGACTCEGCSITAQPDCYPEQIPTHVNSSSAPACDKSGVPLDPKNVDGCNSVTATLPDYASATPPAPQGGACTLNPTPHPDKLTSVGARVCVPSSASCEAEICAEGGGAFAECIWADGNTTCPDGPFTERHLAGTSPALACGDCGCKVEGAKCGGTLVFYGSYNCTGSSVQTLPVNDMCVPTAKGTTLHSFTFQPSVSSAACAMAAPSNPTITMDALKTICCR